jgi:tetratricopeptide (TPR) repeat protein
MMNRNERVEPGLRIRPEDFAHAEISFTAENSTSGIPIIPNKKNRLVEVDTHRLTVSLPRQTCAVGHTLVFRIVVKHTPRGVAPRNSMLVADQFILITAKVASIAETPNGNVIVELELFQMIEREWQRFIESFIQLQEQISRTLGEMNDQDVFTPEKRPENPKKSVADFLANKRVLMVDPIGVFSTLATRHLSELGVDRKNFITATSLEIAEEILRNMKPEIVLSQHREDQPFSTALARQHASIHPDPTQRIFCLISEKNSATLIPAAAEAGADCLFILPISKNNFQKIVMETALAKLNPSAYGKTLLKGRSHLESGDYKNALTFFESAKGFSKAPALACYYEGVTRSALQEWDQAEQCFREGLDHNPNHYKCLTGLFDALVDRKNYTEAYEVGQKLGDTHPLNPERIPDMIRLSVSNERYQDILSFYESFAVIDPNDEFIAKHLAAGLVVCGKYFLKKGDRASALAALQRAETASKGKVAILREIALTLKKAGLKDELSGFLTRAPREIASDPAVTSD